MFEIVLKLYRLIFARQIFKTFNTNMFRLSLSGFGILNYGNDRMSGERHFIRKILPRYIKSDKPIFFDVGANIGNYSSGLIDSFPNAFVYSFEPQPKNFLRLREKVFSKNVKCYNVAVGATYGKAILYDRSDYDGSEQASLYKEVISDIYKTGVVSTEIVVDTIDDISKREGIDFIDFLKIDTEGHEFAVLQGASTLLKNGRIGCIHFEFNEMNIVSRVFFRDFCKLLHNYKLYRLLPNGLFPLGNSPLETELFAYQNIVALPK